MSRKEFHAGIAERMPRKRVAAGALIRDDTGRLLMIRPTYKPQWVIPGGVVEADEDPHAACVREIREELGVDRPVGRLLVIDWLPRHGVWGDSLQLVFDGGRLDAPALTGLVLQPEEVASVTLAALSEIAEHVRPSMHRRLTEAAAAAEDGTTRYLQFGRSPVTG